MMFSMISRKIKKNKIKNLVLILGLLFAYPAWAQSPHREDSSSFNQATIAYVEKDYTTALELLTPLANYGHIQAMSILGELYRTGKGTPKDHPKAFFWHQKASNLGGMESQHYLGILFAYGYHNEQGEFIKDEIRAIEWFQKAAEQGNPVSQIKLGIVYGLGQGTPIDNPKAAFWLLKAAHQEEIAAQEMLGSIYLYTELRDIDQAIFWLEKASYQKSTRAQESLGRVYLKEFKDLENGFIWCNVAAIQKNPSPTARNCRNLAAQEMSYQEILQAEAKSKSIHDRIYK